MGKGEGMGPDWEDIDAFLSVDEFAVQVILKLSNGTVRPLRGIFDDPYLNAQLGEYELDLSRPRLTCKWVDVKDVTRGDVVEIAGRSYDILSGAQGDGTGMAILDLAPQDQA